MRCAKMHVKGSLEHQRCWKKHGGPGRFPKGGRVRVSIPKVPHGTGLTKLVERAVDEVAAKAWLAVIDCINPKEQLSRAKHEALKHIKALPANIRGRVEHKFISEKWNPLIARKPRPLDP
jgi:hypothetical protein